MGEEESPDLVHWNILYNDRVVVLFSGYFTVTPLSLM